MNLAEAYGALSPLEPDPARRREAAEVLYDWIKGACAKLSRTWNEDWIEEAKQDLLERLLRTGKRYVVSDEEAGAILYRSLENRLRDIARKHRPSEELEDPPAPPPVDPEGLIDVKSIRAAFMKTVVEAAASSQRGGRGSEGFRETVKDLFALADGTKDFDDVVRRRHPEVAGEAEKKARAALHAEHLRARRRLVETIEELLELGRISPESAALYRNLVGNYLRRRQ